MLAVLAIACWAAPLAAALGTEVVQQGLLVALPLTLALQWGLRSRYLGRPQGLAHLRRHGRELVLFPVALVGGLGAGHGPERHRGRAADPDLDRRHRADPAPLVAGLRRARDRRHRRDARRASRRWPSSRPRRRRRRWASCSRSACPRRPCRSRPGASGRAVAATMIGAGLGALLVADPTVDWTVGAVPALALLPSTVASFWGGYHLWRFQQVIPRALSGVPVAGPDTRNPAWPGAAGAARRRGPARRGHRRAVPAARRWSRASSARRRAGRPC